MEDIFQSYFIRLSNNTLFLGKAVKWRYVLITCIGSIMTSAAGTLILLSLLFNEDWGILFYFFSAIFFIFGFIAMRMPFRIFKTVCDDVAEVFK
jgi:uncharacterized membrane protein YfcA